jgi:hypothetical protein
MAGVAHADDGHWRAVRRVAMPGRFFGRYTLMRRTICSVLALVLTLGFAEQATATERDKLSDTKWKHVDPADNTTFRIEFAENGTFTFNVTGSPEVKGLYSIDGDSLLLKIIGRDAKGKLQIETVEVKLVSVGEGQMTTRLNNRERKFMRVH